MLDTYAIKHCEDIVARSSILKPSFGVELDTVFVRDNRRVRGLRLCWTGTAIMAAMSRTSSPSRGILAPQPVRFHRAEIREIECPIPSASKVGSLS
jgi:hypothetical protein